MSSNNIFFCWSGNLSKKMALIFMKRIKNIVPSANPFMSVEISKGKQWLPAIVQAINDCKYAIIFITKENAESSWLHFESGAIFKGLATNYISPFLINTNKIKLKEPLSMFQGIKNNKDGLSKLFKSINEALGSDMTSAELREKWEDNSDDLMNDIKKLLKEKTAKSLNVNHSPNRTTKKTRQSISQHQNHASDQILRSDKQRLLMGAFLLNNAKYNNEFRRFELWATEIKENANRLATLNGWGKIDKISGALSAFMQKGQLKNLNLIQAIKKNNHDRLYAISYDNYKIIKSELNYLGMKIV